VQSRDQALQKHGYKVLAYLCRHREDFFRADFQKIVDALLGGVATSLSAPKRFRLMCLQAVILVLQGAEPPPLDLRGTPDQTPEEERNQVGCRIFFSSSWVLGSGVFSVSEALQKFTRVLPMDTFSDFPFG
jgi:hypothetical protein